MLTQRLRKAKWLDDFEAERPSLEEKAASLDELREAVGELQSDTAILRDAWDVQRLERERGSLRAEVEELRQRLTPAGSGGNE